jgi:hypothetical protein
MVPDLLAALPRNRDRLAAQAATREACLFEAPFSLLK